MMKNRSVSMSFAVLVGAVAGGCGDYAFANADAGASISTDSSVSGDSSGGTTSGDSSGGMTSGDAGGGMTPCDVLAAGGNPCVAAHSTVRVVYPGYAGPLYQVCLGAFAAGPNGCSSNMTKDIMSVGGYADGASQDTFCAGATCTITIIYDQSPNHTDLQPTPSGGGNKNSADNPAIANGLQTTIHGHEAYGILVKPGVGYRAGCLGCAVPVAKGTATGDEPETEYMVTSQNHLINGCCFDYGNAETDSHDDGDGTMEAVYFGGGVVWGTGAGGGHVGPWVEADLEMGTYAGWGNGGDYPTISTNLALPFNFVTAVVVGDTADKNGGMGRFAIYGSDATSLTLMNMYDGIRPAKPGYNPMQKQGSIILGTGGDNSDGDGGEWFEGVMASGAATVATLNNLQANIVAAGYGQ